MSPVVCSLSLTWRGTAWRTNTQSALSRSRTRRVQWSWAGRPRKRPWHPGRGPGKAVSLHGQPASEGGGEVPPGQRAVGGWGGPPPEGPCQGRHLSTPAPGQRARVWVPCRLRSARRHRHLGLLGLLALPLRCLRTLLGDCGLWWWPPLSVDPGGVGTLQSVLKATPGKPESQQGSR